MTPTSLLLACNTSPAPSLSLEGLKYPYTRTDFEGHRIRLLFLCCTSHTSHIYILYIYYIASPAAARARAINSRGQSVRQQFLHRASRTPQRSNIPDNTRNTFQRLTETEQRFWVGAAIYPWLECCEVPGMSSTKLRWMDYTHSMKRPDSMKFGLSSR
jgi:hypothetical protein